MPFGQIVIGPPGSGKTTYCNGMQQFMTAVKRPVAVVNLDPANDSLPYECDVDVSELIRVEHVMEQYKLGPNGALVFCMKFLLKNLEWLKEKILPLSDKYLLFDMPGQVELYTHDSTVKQIVAQICKWDFRLTCVHLVDSYYCIEPTSFISILLLSLSTMLQLELPHVNVLSKIDLLHKFGDLKFNLEYYAEVQDLSYLLHHLDGEGLDGAEEDEEGEGEGEQEEEEEDDEEAEEKKKWVRRWSPKFRKLNRIICEVVGDYSLVAFATLNITDKESVWNLLQIIDKSNGYLNLSVENDQYLALLSYCVSTDFDSEYLQKVQEKYIDGDGTIEEAEEMVPGQDGKMEEKETEAKREQKQEQKNEQKEQEKEKGEQKEQEQEKEEEKGKEEKKEKDPLEGWDLS